MNDNKIEVVLKVSNKTGVLAGVMLKVGKLGLMIDRNKTERIDEETSKLILSFNGELKCNKTDFIVALESHSEVYSVLKVLNVNDYQKVVPNSNEPITKTYNRSSVVNSSTVKLRAIDYITPESLRVAEEKLSKLIGPIAPMLIQSAKAETRHVGDLFMLLAEELEGEERNEFLSSVSGLTVK